MSANLIVIVPSRGRPYNVSRVAAAWSDTDAWADGAELLFAVDRDDPEHDEYHAAVQRAAREYGESVTAQVLPTWEPMVRKLDKVATALARGGFAYALGFAGDDHLPRTAGWVQRYTSTLYDFGSGFVSCPDGYRTDDLPTQWAVTADIVQALGRMVPAPVDHLYCDDSIRDVAKGAGVYAYLDDVFIEHMHPVAGKVETDEQYDRVNGSRQRKYDKRAYRAWRDNGGLEADVRLVRALRDQGETA
jgi:hypothetical protein